MSAGSFFKSLLCRLLAYYVIYSAVYGCWHQDTSADANPGVCSTATNQLICKPLHLAYDYYHPYVSPYYDEHVKPKVDPIVSEVSRYSSIVQRHSQPIVAKSKHLYGQHVDPLVHRYSDPVYDSILQLHQKHAQPHIDYAKNTLSKSHDYLENFVDNSLDFVEFKMTPAMASIYWKYVDPVASYIEPKATKFATFVYTNAKPRLEKTLTDSWVYVVRCTSFVINYSQTVIAPHVKTIYLQSIEPQLFKIRDHIFRQKPVDMTAGSHVNTDSTLATADEPTADSSIASSTQVEASDTASETTSSVTGLAETVANVPNEANSTGATSSAISDITTTLSSTPVPRSLSSQSSSSIRDAATKAAADKGLGEDLAHWKAVVQDTSNMAFNTFLDDAEEIKSKALDDEKENFIQILRKLQKSAATAHEDLSVLVNNLEKNESISAAEVQNEFRKHTDIMRLNAENVRQHSLSFADSLLEKLEKVRKSTVDLFDEFADVTLQEIGRKMVSSASAESSSGAQASSASWQDWKEFRQLKDLLWSSRQELLEYEVPMAEVNLALRETQETANILVQEGVALLSGLRGKADYILQQRAIEKAQEEEKAGTVATSVPNAEYVEELEDDDEEDLPPLTITITSSITSTVTSDLQKQSAQPAVDVTDGAVKVEDDQKLLKVNEADEDEDDDDEDYEDDEDDEDDEEDEDEDDEEDVDVEAGSTAKV